MLYIPSIIRHRFRLVFLFQEPSYILKAVNDAGISGRKEVT
jgi:hypothetical protein